MAMDLERLSQIGSTLGQRPYKKKSESAKGEKTKAVSFRSALDKAEAEEAVAASGLVDLPSLDGTEDVEGLLDDVHSAGEALKKDPVMGPLKEYKTAVRRFLRYVLENGVTAEETLGIRNPKTLQQKKYVLLRVVDERLDSLVAHVLKGQAEQLDILRRIEEINGLLIDLKG